MVYYAAFSVLMLKCGAGYCNTVFLMALNAMELSGTALLRLTEAFEDQGGVAHLRYWWTSLQNFMDPVSTLLTSGGIETCRYTES